MSERATIGAAAWLIALIIGIGVGAIVGSLLAYCTGYDATDVGAGVVVGAGLALRL